MNLGIGNDWDDILEEETEKDYFQKLTRFVQLERSRFKVYPPRDKVFAALQYVPFRDVKAVIVGQDPYINANQANGLAFAVADSTQAPPSLQNIFKEVSSDLGVDMSGKSTELTGWAAQGVLLLNATLTVRAGLSNSHQNCGWQEFTDSVIRILGKRVAPMVFILWGANAAKKEEWIGKQHCVIKSAHPSPLSSHRGFFGSKPFSRANAFLSANGMEPIDWARTENVFVPGYYGGKGKIGRV